MAFEQEFDLGLVTAYAYAVSKGYTGTEEEFAELMASYATVAEAAAASAAAAAGSADEAEAARDKSAQWATGGTTGTPGDSNNAKYYSEQAAAQAAAAATKASEAASSAAAAAGSATTASDKAGEAAASATAAAGSATTASQQATAAAGSATTAGSKANEASESANNAATAKTAAQAAQTAAEAAQTAAETAQGEAEDAAASVSESAAQIATNTEDITELKSALEKYYNGLALFTGNWAIGLIGGSVGQEIQYNPGFTNRVSNLTTQKFDYDLILYSQSGYTTSVFILDSSDKIISSSDVTGGNSKTIPANTYFRVMVVKPTPETIGNNINAYIQAVTHTVETHNLYAKIDRTNVLVGFNTDAIQDLFDGFGYFTNFEYGTTDGSGNATNPPNHYTIRLDDWTTVDKPLALLPIDSAYSYRVYWKNIGYSNLSENVKQLLFPNVQFKIVIWKTNSTVDFDLNEVRQKLLIQTRDDYLSIRSKLCADKLNAGKCLFDEFVRRGSLWSGNYVDYVSYRCATPNIIRYSHDVTISPESGFRFAVHTFTSQDVFEADLGWKTSAFKISAGQGFKLIIARTTDNTSEVADPDVFIMGISVASEFATKNDIKTIPMFNNGFLQTGGKPKLAAHMGYHVDCPGNSVPAYQEAGRKGFWGIEADVNQTSDKKFVMIHDTTVDATTDGSGSVNEMTLAEIRALHLTGTQLQVPTLEEYLGICKRYGCVPVIEIKSTITEYASFVETLKTFGFDKSCIVIGSKWSIGGMKNVSQNIPYASIYQSGFTPDFDTELAYNAAYENSGMDWDYLLTVDLTKAKKLHDLGMLFGTFTVDNADNVLDAFEKGVDFVTTNTVLPIDIT